MSGRNIWCKFRPVWTPGIAGFNQQGGMSCSILCSSCGRSGSYPSSPGFGSLGSHLVAENSEPLFGNTILSSYRDYSLGCTLYTLHLCLIMRILVVSSNKSLVLLKCIPEDNLRMIHQWLIRSNILLSILGIRYNRPKRIPERIVCMFYRLSLSSNIHLVAVCMNHQWRSDTRSDIDYKIQFYPRQDSSMIRLRNC